MSGEGMPKRNRNDTPPQRRPAPPVEVVEVPDTPPSTPPHDAPDALLEQQLDALEVDEDFRESIRAMTPNTRRDVLNDIIRHQQHTEVQEELQGFGVHNGLPNPFFFLHGDAHGGAEHDGHPDVEGDEEWVDDEESKDEEEEQEEEEDVTDMDARDRHTRPFVFRPAGALFGQRFAAPDDDAGRPNLGDPFGEREGGPVSFIDFLQLVSQHVGGQPLGPQGVRGRAAAQQQQQRTLLEERMLSLHNLVGMLQQANAMQSMGLDRDIDDMSYEELLELEERIGNVSKGVPPAQLESCMTRVQAPAPDETCPICQEELHAAAPPRAAASSAKACVKLVNCPHIFHKPCIKQWLANNKTCPVCKQEVLPQSGAPSP